MGDNQKLDEMKQGFVSIAAHELRTPLTAIKGYLAVFLSDYQDSLNKDQQDLLAHIQDNTDRLILLVENLLNVSRVERGALALSLENLQWEDIVKQVTDDFREKAAEKNIQLNLIPPEQKLPAVRADKLRMIEVLSNLLSNAIMYTNPGGRVQITTSSQDNFIITNIADNGKGIPKEAIPNLFTKFFRVTQGLTQDQNAAGTGLGLYIAKAIIDMHKGKIWVNSQEGKGSVFSFALPINP